MECHVKPVEQGSDEWLELRMGRITASNLGHVMAKPNTKRYQDYHARISQEMLGIKQEEIDAPWFAHGKTLEPRALRAYRYKFDIDLQHDVFLVSKEYDWLGCSPDGLYPDHTAGVEVKCRAEFKTYIAHRTTGEFFEHRNALRCVPPSERFQVQGAMWVTGFDSWEFVNYYEGVDDEGKEVRKLCAFTIPRDQELIDRMEERAHMFMLECYETAGKEPGDLAN